MKTNVDDFIGELGAGVLKEKLAVALSDVAMGTVQHNSKGKLTIELAFSKMGDHDQLIVSHKIKSTTPTRRGKRTDEDTTSTAFFVGKGGQMTIQPPKEDMQGQFNLTVQE